MHFNMYTLFAITVVTFMISSISVADSDSNAASHVIMAPKVLRRGSDFKVSVSILKSNADVLVTVQILDSHNGSVVQDSSTIRTGTTANIILKIPQNLKENSFQFFVYATGGLQFEKLVTVDAVSKTLSLFVQTDKALYKPGQKVLYRAITVYPDLMPYKGPVDISIYDVAGNKIVQQNKKVNETGVISGELLLSDQTPLGVWKVKVEAGGNIVERSFEVAEYVLPKFKVVVDLPSYYFINSKEQSVQSPLPVTISAQYTYGQPVKGQVSIAVQLAPYAWDNAKYPQKLLSATLTEGRFDVSVPIKDILQLIPSEHIYRDRLSVLPYRSILVIANVTEVATGKMFSSNATVSCRDRRYEIKFLDMSPNSYKSGLVYTGFMQLTQVDGSQPLPSDVGSLVTLTVTTFLQNSSTITQKFDNTVTENGLMSFTLNIAHSSNVNVQLQASYKEHSTDIDAVAFKSLVKFESRDNESIQLSLASNNGIIKAGEVLTFHVKLTVPLESYSYQILAKSTIVLGDTVVKSSPSIDHQFQLTFSENLTRVLMPSARIVTWAITKDGEIISDSIEVNIATSFANNVSLSFNKGQVQPGDHVSLTVNAQQGSYIGLLAVDQSVRLLKTGNDVTKETVFDELKLYDSSSKYGREQRRGGCLLWPVFSGGQDTTEVFDNAGLVVITDAYIFKRETKFDHYYNMEMANAEDFVDEADDGIALQQKPRPRIMFKSASLGSSEPAPQLPTVQPRVVFPETWLWSDAVADSNGSVNIKLTVPDTITSWVASAFAVSSNTGLGVAASNTHLTVFKPFFVSLNLPYSIVRGEEFALKVTVFNYLATEVSVLVTLRKSTNFKVRHINAVEPEEIELTDTVSVAANDAQTVFFWIVPVSLGQIPIEVHAQSHAAADAERKLLLVKPEGVSQEYSTSLFIDLSKGGRYSSTLEISLPPTGVVPASQHIELTAIGDLLGPSINGLDSLIRMPYGCGEQNMLNFAPNIYIMNYLTLTSQLTSIAAEKSQRYMMAGYQRELTYQRHDGSFSAFGNSDPAGSVWLSAFVAKCFHEAKEYIPVEENKIANTLNWIINLQSTNGAFAEPPQGKVIHTDMQGGSSNGVALTAYVLIALLENNKTEEIDQALFRTVIDKARVFLESNLESIRSDPYAVSIITYALSLAGSTSATSAFNMLSSLAIIKNGLMHWEKPEVTVPSKEGFWQPPYSQSRAVNVEMTSYALLTYALRRDVSGGVPIAKWIVSQRNPNGGFSSTQDTVVALQALAAFASLTTLPPGGDSEIRITATFGQSTHHFQPISRESALLLQTAEIPTDVKQVEITANGNGVGLVQLNVKFNTNEVDKAAGVTLTVSTDQKNNVVSLVSCGRWTSTEQPSGMVVMDISQLTGFAAINIDKLKEDLNDQGLKRVESDDERLVLYFDELTDENTCVTVQSEKVRMVSNIQKAAVKLYSYYDPGSADTAFYLPPEASAQTNDLCSSCPQCCGVPEPRQIQHSGGARVITITTLVGFLMTLTIASLLSYLLFA